METFNGTRLALLALTVTLATWNWAGSAAVFAGSAKAPTARENPKTAAIASGEVRTEFFSIRLPQGWVAPHAPQKKPLGISAVFANAKTGLAVTFNVLRANMPAAELAKTTVARMRASGLKVTEPARVGNFYRVNLSGKVGGQAWFMAKDGLCSATVILGANPADANVLLKALEAPDRSLFPAAVK